MRVDKTGKLRIDGIVYPYIGQMKWSRMHYSFDLGETWSTSKRKAFDLRTTKKEER